MSASGSNVHKLHWLANLYTRVIKREQILGTVFFRRVYKFKVYTLNKLNIINFFTWHHRVIESVDENNKFCQACVGMFQHSTTHISSKLCRNRSVQPEVKKCSFLQKLFCSKLGEGKMHPFALHKISTQTVDSSQVLANCIPTKATERNSKVLQKNGTKTQIKTKIFFQRFDRWRQFYSNWYYHVEIWSRSN